MNRLKHISMWTLGYDQGAYLNTCLKRLKGGLVNYFLGFSDGLYKISIPTEDFNVM